MNNCSTLPSGLVAIEAEYKEQILDEYNENPFIQALPQIKTKEEIVTLLANNIKYKNEERNYDSNIRLHLLQRIFKIYQPLPIHLKVYNMIDNLIRQGYIARNPISKEYKKHINLLGERLINKEFSVASVDNYNTTAICGLIIGISGMGKTSSVNKVLENYPKVIVHNTYKNKHFNNIQIPYIKLEAPHNGSLKALTLQFFMKVDELLGTENMKRYVSRNLSVDAMLPLMGQLANNIGLGLLVIDELQHINKNSAQVMNYFVALSNTFGVSLLLIGTPACYAMLEQEMRIARRVTGAGEIIWNNMKNDKEFELFIKGIWKYQYIENECKLDRKIIDAFYDKTQGITDLVVKLFIACQRAAIESGVEKITIKLVDKVWEKEFKLINPMVTTIRSSNVNKMFKYEDIRILEDTYNKSIPKCSHNVRHDKPKETDKIEVVKAKKIIVSELDDEDIRKIIIKGLKRGKEEYEILKDNEIIKDFNSILQEKKDDK